MTHEYFRLSDPVMDALDSAGNLREEFMAAFLQSLGVTDKQVEEAICYALREWDL